MTLQNFLSPFNSKKNKGDKNFKNWVKATTGFKPKNIVVYQQAFLHSSAGVKRDNQPISNERLEFLGDAILGAVIADYLFKIYPYKDEGFLTQLRSKIVNGQNLKALSLKFGFDVYLKANLTKDEKLKSSAFGDAFEAFIGAIYIDLGYEKTKSFIGQKIIKFHIDIEALVNIDTDYKSQLQIYCQKNKLALDYRLMSEEKIGATKVYVIQVFINQKAYVKFENISKRVAEQKAAQLTLEELQLEIG